jgi:putative restriction endonuclease
LSVVCCSPNDTGSALADQYFPVVINGPEFDAVLRMEAQRWLTVRTNDGQVPISSSDLLDFEVDGQPFRLMDAQRGIRKPRELSSALSIRTVYTVEGKERPYADEVGPDGLLRYKWRGDDPDHAENRALRAAMNEQAPLIWFFGVAPGVYKPIYPVYLLWEEQELHQFIIDPDVARGLVSQGSQITQQVRRYIIRQTKQRLHQPVFRATVLRAYETRCAVCALRHAELLDAAHIVPDSHEAGSPPCATAWRSARSTMLPTTARFSGSGRIWSSRFVPTCSTRSTGRCWSTA